MYHTWVFCLYSVSRITRGVYPQTKKNHAFMWPHASRNVTSSERFVFTPPSLTLASPLPVCLTLLISVISIMSISGSTSRHGRCSPMPKQSPSVGKSVSRLCLYTSWSQNKDLHRACAMSMQRKLHPSLSVSISTRWDGKLNLIWCNCRAGI